MLSGIYKIYWHNNPYYYYGQSQHLPHRFEKHRSQFRTGKNSNERIQRVFNKYGMPIFENIELCEIDKLNEREQVYIDMYFNDKNCCNMTPTAGSTRGYKMPAHVIESIKKTWTGRKHTEETRKRMSESGKLKRLTEDHKRKLRLTCKNRGLNGVMVLDRETGIYYDTVLSLSKSINVNHSSLCKKIKKNLSNRFIKI